MKKWDQRYFVATTGRLYYFKTQEDFKRGNVHPSGIIVLKDHVVEAAPSNCEFDFVLRGADRTYKFKADDEGMAHRWITALRAVQISSMAEWSTREMASFGQMVGFPKEFLNFLMANNMDGNGFARLKTSAQLAEKRYFGRTDTIWSLLNNLRTPDVHDWLTRFSAFCQKSELAAEPLRLFCAEFNLTNGAGLCRCFGAPAGKRRNDVLDSSGQGSRGDGRTASLKLACAEQGGQLSCFAAGYELAR